MYPLTFRLVRSQRVYRGNATLPIFLAHDYDGFYWLTFIARLVQDVCDLARFSCLGITLPVGRVLRKRMRLSRAVSFSSSWVVSVRDACQLEKLPKKRAIMLTIDTKITLSSQPSKKANSVNGNQARVEYPWKALK